MIKQLEMKNIKEDSKIKKAQIMVSKWLRQMEQNGLYPESQVLRRLIFNGKVDWNFAIKQINKEFPEVEL